MLAGRPPASAQTPGSDATLSSLTLSEGRLSPAFTSGTRAYTASVGYTVTRITITPTTTDTQATVAYLDGSEQPLPDADVASGQQVDLVVYENVINVRVTSRDTNTTETYTVTVTRTEEDTSLSPQASDPVAAFSSTAVYDLVFQGTWTVAATPGGVPSGAHFSRLIGGVHSDAVTFLESGGTASAGVESMAELGGWSGLEGEVQNAGSGALSVLSGATDSISPATSKTLTATLTTEHPRITLVTMVAPSPDWFVGVSGLPLLDDQGRWLRSHEVNLYPWDAGTEDGSEFSLNNLATNPQGVITSIRGTGKFSTERIATLRFTLRSVSTTRSVAENTAAGVDIGAPAAATAVGGGVTYTLGGTDAASFDIVSSTGQLQAKAALDYETKSSYEVTVTGTDTDGSVTTTVSIDVTNVVELASAISGPASPSFMENQGGRVATYTASSEEDRDGITWSLSGADAADFSIDSPPGALRFHIDPVSPRLFPEPPDFEVPRDSDTGNTYNVTLVATAVGGATTNHAVTVTVTDEDDAGVISLPSTKPRVGHAYTVSLSDADTVSGAASWKWERSAGRGQWTTIEGAGTSSYTPVAADSGEYLRITASYSDGGGSGKSVQVVLPHVVAADLLASLSVTTRDSTAGPAWRQMRPTFSSETLHYSIGCRDSDFMRLTFAAADASSRLAVTRTQFANPGSGNSLLVGVNVEPHSDVQITVTDGAGGQTEYVVHCLAPDFEKVTARKEAGATEELFLIPRASYLLILDNNAVPRYRRQLDHNARTYFRFYENGGNGEYRYSYTKSETRTSVILDEDLEVIDEASTVAPLTRTDGHDFRVLESGNYLLMAYQPAVRDLSFLTFSDSSGNPFGTSVSVEDSAIQIITPEDQAVFNWNSWDYMPLEDCAQHRFPPDHPDYAHLNSTQLVDGKIIASFRGCNRILSIDASTGEVLWRIGPSNLSDAEWEARGIGPAPMAIVGDPEGQFCGEHAVHLLPNGNLLMYDNGAICTRNPWSGDNLVRDSNTYSRALEYFLDFESNEAVFVRDHSLRRSKNRLGFSSGHVSPLENGGWLISWGRNNLRGSGSPLPPDVAVTQVDPATGKEVLSLDWSPQTRPFVRVTAMPPYALARQPRPLTADLPSTSHTSLLHRGTNHTPQVVVTFSRAVVDFNEASPSLSVQGATVAGVSPHLVTDEPAHSYLIALTPDGDGTITFRLLTAQDCASGGICTADGTMLSEAPSALDIPRAPNDEPEFPSSSATRSVDENTPAGQSIGDLVAAADDDGDTLTYSLTSGGATFGIVAMTGQLQTKAALDHETHSSHTVTVAVHDGKASDGTTSTAIDDTITVTITVTDVEEAPEFPSATAARSVDEDLAVGQNVGAPVEAMDDEGDALTYSLDGADAASFAIVATSGQLQTKAALDFETKRTHTVVVGVSDRKDVDGEPVAETVPDIDDTVVVTVTVNNVDEPPSVHGLESFEVAENTSGVLNTYTALDPEGVTDFAWSVSGTDASAFTISETPGPSGQLSFAQPPDFETPLDNGRDNVYNVTVEASDSRRTGRRAVVVRVSNLQETPAFPSPSTTRSVDEDIAVGEDVGAPVAASDGDRDALSYSLATTSSLFEIDSTSGQLRTRAALDHATMPRHVLVVRVSDGKDANGNAVVASNDIDDTIRVMITVNDVEETPEFPSASTDRRVDEDLAVGRNVGAPIEASDGDNDALTYSLATPSSVFAIDPASGQLRTRAALDHETGSSYTIIVRVSDGKDAGGNADSAIDDTISVTITVTNLDEPGMLTVTPNQPQVGTRLTASLSDPDGGISGLSWQWQVRESGAWSDVAGATSGRYTPVAADEGKRLRVTASYTDGHDSGKSATRTLTDAVQAAPVTNSAPEFPSSSTTRSVPENTPAGVDIGDPVEASDDDGDDLTYTLDRASRNLFEIGAGGQLRTRAALDHEARSSYSVTVTATDRSGTSDTISVRIDVADVEESPTFDSASTTRGVTENTPAGRPIGDPVAATDGDRDALTYSLGGADAASFAIDPSTGRLRTRAALDHETTDSYSVTVSVSDGKDADGNADSAVDDTISVTINVADIEEAPAFPAGTATRMVAENTPTDRNIGDPVEASDGDGDALTYSLSGADAASFAIDSTTGQLRTRHALDFETKTSYSFTTSVSDGMNADGEPVAGTVPDIDDTIDVTITVTNVNEAPTLSGRERINAREIATVEVTTYEAVDPEHDDLTWSLSGTDSDDFTISSSGALAFRSLPDFERPTDFGRNNVYQFTLQVSDAKSATGDPDPAIDATLDVTVTVTNVGERGEITVSPSPARVGAGLTASLSDPDGGVTNLTWQWQISANGASWSDIAGATSARYTPLAADEGRFLRVTASYSDDQARATTAEATLAGAVQSAPNTPPRFRASSTSRSVPENTARGNIGAPVTASDDDGDTLSYSLGGADAASFAIVASSGQLQTRNALDFETPRSYSVSVSVSDGKDADGNPDSSSDDSISVTISVSDVNEPPAFPGTLSTALSVDENTPASRNIGDPLTATDEDAGSTLTYSLAGAAAGSFTIAGGGQLQTSAALDFETRGAYSLSVSVSDGRDANGDEDSAADANIAITVTVNDLEEDGAISVPSDQPQVGAALTASLSDPDRGVTGVTWQWQVSDDQSAWSDIKTATSASYTPEAGDENRYLRVTASYSDRRGPGKEAERSLPNPVQAAPTINRPPQFPAPSTSRSVPENTPRGEDIGAPIAAADSDTLRYALSGDHASSFSIDRNTGQLRTNAALDHENRSSYSLTVTATDPSTTSDSIAVTINVTDRNEPPAFPTSLRAPLSVDENTAPGRNIGSPLTAIDEDDGDSLIYSLDSAGDAVFGIDPEQGLLRTEAPLNHEMTDSYRVVVQVSDGDDDDGKPDPASDDTLTLTVRVTDRNEPPAVSGETSISYAEDRTDPVASYDHNDPDEGETISWSRSGPDAGDFAIDASGVLSFRNAPDFEQPADAGSDNEYHVTVVASDGSLSSRLDVTVTVTGVNEPPRLSGRTAVPYPENGTGPVATYAHNDPDQPPTITWSLAGPDARHFDFDDDSGELTFRETPDHERARDANRENDYELTVTASDGAFSDSLEVTVTVTDVNEPPTLTGRTSITVDEHAERFVAGYSAADPDVDAALGWTLGGADATHFELSADGELRFRAEPDYEAGRNNVYHVIVRVFDGANTPALSVTVTVANVDEPGEITLGSLQPQVGTAVSAALSDPDGSLSGRSWQWQLSGDRNDWSDIAGATAASYTPVAADEGRFLRVTASYTDGHGPGKTAATALDAVRAAPAASNTPPAFPASESGRRSVPENTPAAQPIGDPVGAVDDDPGDTTALTYSLDVASDTVFDINPQSGQLLTAAPLNHEQHSSYTIIVTATDPSTAVASIRVTITVEDVDEPPELSGDTVVSIPENSGRPVATYSATDPERTPLIWRLEGRDAGAFELVDGVLSFLAPPDFESPANVAGVNTYELTILVSDGAHSPTLAVTVIVTDVDESALGSAARDTGGPISIGGGGGGPSGPTPSDVDFEWTVTRDVEALDPGNDWPTGLWSDGRVLWIAENGSGADDEVYAYDLKSGERLEQREFELAETNRAPRGFWSDGETVWVSDSGQDRLFAYDLESGERLEQREFELAPRNRDPRAIWSGGAVMWVLDGGKDSLFGYDLETGELLAEYELAAANSDPRGLWSDGVSVWVSDHGAKRLFAYRLPVLDGDAVEDEQAQPLERVREEEFKELSKASNNSPRGLWSDGAVMYVADESDDKVYSYNLPDALDARLASLTLSDVEIGAFSPARTEYESTVTAGVTLTTVAAAAEQRGATVAIDPADADEDAEGHQIALARVEEIAVTVTSSDGSRERVYRVRIAEAEAAGPSASCLRGAIAVGFSLVASEGGSIEQLVACAQSRSVTALYVLVQGEWVSYILGAPVFVNEAFGERFADGLPALTPLVAKSEGPSSPAPASDEVPEFGPDCLRGAIATGFSLVLSEGGSVDDLEACAQDRNVSALYALHEGEFVPYILGAPEFVNQRFRDLYPEGVPAITPLVAKSEEPPAGGPDRDDAARN